LPDASSMSATNSLHSRRDMNNAAHDEGATVLLDPIGGHQVDPPAEEIFQAIAQVHETEANRLGETHQQIHIAGGRWLIASEGSKQGQVADLELEGQIWIVLTQPLQHLRAAGAGGDRRGGHRGSLG